ncbi:PvdO, pyoverdine responsive serine/threonine kinase (predicted by OlgaV) [Rhodovastum atsumiense]|nr:SUMF1/EgtB/PvdO family nonheme iron enzyme [Rhodovastum atsumiense]CAH2601936.1 PvdO, pyoverdine responsive serine/threonine kinase (predicted by OlgaV) [Rhodovastum atsumiense]
MGLGLALLLAATAPARADWRETLRGWLPGLGQADRPRPAPAPVAAPLEVIRDCADCPDMVLIQAGSFEMGVPRDEDRREGTRDADARPVHPVRITQAFYLGKYHVTRGQYAAFAHATGRPVKPPVFPQADDHPAVNIAWADAVAYAAWLSQRTGRAYRLPSEAEWEYAARAGTVTARYWGDSPEGQCLFANGWDQSAQSGVSRAGTPSCEDGYEFTAPVGRFRPNAFGLHDMLGNATQWVQDCWHTSYEQAPADGTADQSGACTSRVLRGGSWIHYPWWLRAGYRAGVAADLRLDYFGFRLARSAAP